MEIADHDAVLNNVANRRLAVSVVASLELDAPRPGCTTHSPKLLPPGYLLHYPINILIHIFRLASRDDRSTLLALSRVSKFFHEVCKPLAPPIFTPSRATYIMELMELGRGTRAELDRQPITLPDLEQIQNLQDEHPSKPTVCNPLHGKSYSSPRPHTEREMCNRETQVEPGDSKTTASPRGYLLNYPVDLLTRIFELICFNDAAAGRSLCLVSKGFYAVVKPIMLCWVQLKRPTQILHLAHLVPVDVAARVGILRLTINIPDMRKALLCEEPHWGEEDRFDRFSWDSECWGDPDAGYDSDESGGSDKSSNSFGSDVAFLASSEGGSWENHMYDSDEELNRGREQWPWDAELEKAMGIINSAISGILLAVAPTLRNLELISMDPRLNIDLEIFPKLSELTISTPELHVLNTRRDHLFPALKYLWIQARPGIGFIELDDLVYHAPSVTEIRVPSPSHGDCHFLRQFIRALATPQDPPVTSEGREVFRYVEKIYVRHRVGFNPNKVFKPDEPLFATWKRVVRLLR
ncbi:hypothetical protein BD779DRAFT_1558051 [Infundibulicybe gibba]|nr:hypothetical protein BD779DRAFT_1558051 [Infundibulicybe gibba]